MADADVYLNLNAKVVLIIPFFGHEKCFPYGSVYTRPENVDSAIRMQTQTKVKWSNKFTHRLQSDKQKTVLHSTATTAASSI